jgi:hypothetical protein
LVYNYLTAKDISNSYLTIIQMSTEIEAPLLNTKYKTIFLNKINKTQYCQQKTQVQHKCYFSYIEDFFIKYLLNIRKQAAIKIQSYFRSKRKSKLVALERKSFKLYYFVRKIIYDLRHSVHNIQRAYKNKKFRRNINELLNLCKTNYTIFYYKYTQPHQTLIPHSLSIKFFTNEGHFKVLQFTYNKILKCFLLFMSKEFEYQDYYLFNFIINGNETIDINFPNEFGSDGRYYNVLNFKTLKENGYISNIKCEEYLPKPRRKMTCPDFKKNGNHTMMKPILKRPSDIAISPRKKVSFNLNTTYFRMY